MADWGSDGLRALDRGDEVDLLFAELEPGGGEEDDVLTLRRSLGRVRMGRDGEAGVGVLEFTAFWGLEGALILSRIFGRWSEGPSKPGMVRSIKGSERLLEHLGQSHCSMTRIWIC